MFSIAFVVVTNSFKFTFILLYQALIVYISFFSNKMEVGTALKDVLLRAQEQDRLTCGVLDAGKMLEM